MVTRATRGFDDYSEDIMGSCLWHHQTNLVAELDIHVVYSSYRVTVVALQRDTQPISISEHAVHNVFSTLLTTDAAAKTNDQLYLERALCPHLTNAEEHILFPK